MGWHNGVRMAAPTVSMYSDRPTRRLTVPPPSAPEEKRDNGGLLAFGLLLIGAGASAWYWEKHHCPKCGPCEQCQGNKCVSVCPPGQTCGQNNVCVTPPPVPTPCNPPCPAGQTCVSGACSGSGSGGNCVYTVRSGDILISICDRAYGAYYFPNGAVIWEWVYNANPQIKATAEAHGIHSNWWHYIYPGEVITLPVCPPGSGRSDAPNCNI